MLLALGPGPALVSASATRRARRSPFPARPLHRSGRIAGRYRWCLREPETADYPYGEKGQMQRSRRISGGRF